MRHRAQRGQAAIETVIVAPLLALALGSGLGVALAAADWVSAEGAARTGARAAELSLPVGPAVRAALPPALAAGVHIARDDGRVVVAAPARRAGPFGSLAPPAARSRPAP